MTIIINWNVEWKTKSSPKGKELIQRIMAHDPDVVCVTEAERDFLPGGYVIEASSDYRYYAADKPKRRKVILWSKRPWQGVDQVGRQRLPPGRFVGGSTETPLGSLYFVGVCIPWWMAHVNSGCQDRRPWEEHLAYLRGVQGYLAQVRQKTVVVGDFNQRIPRYRAPVEAFELMQAVFSGGLSIETAGVIAPIGKQTVDHVAVTADLRAVKVEGLSAAWDGGGKLSDHFGVLVELAKVER